MTERSLLTLNLESGADCGEPAAFEHIRRPLRPLCPLRPLRPCYVWASPLSVKAYALSWRSMIKRLMRVRRVCQAQRARHLANRGF